MSNITGLYIASGEHPCVLDLREAELPIIFVLTLILNFFALAVLTQMKGTAEGTDYLLVTTLAASDTTSTLLLTIMWLGGWLSCGVMLQNDVVCGIAGWITSSMVIWSADIIIIMSACRYLALTKPIYYRTRVTPRSVSFGLAGTCIFTFLHLIFPFCGVAAPYKFYISNRICGYDFTAAAGGLGHTVLLFIISIEGLVTVLVVLFFNISIICKLRQRSQIVAVTEVHQPSRLANNRKTIFANVTIVVSFVYCLCYGPFLTRVLYDVIVNSPTQNHPRHAVTVSLLFLSPLFNPIVYGVVNKRYRGCLKRMLRNGFKWVTCLKAINQSESTTF